MPKVKGKKYPYTAKGIQQAKTAATRTSKPARRGGKKR